MEPATDHTITMIVSAIVLTGMVLLISPRVLAANKGVALRNIAIWVGIFLLMALAYKTIGPGKDMPLMANETTTIEEDTFTAEPTSTEDEGFRTVR